MQPTPSNPDSPSTADPVADFIRTQRQNIGYALIFLAIAFLVATVMLALKGSRTPDAQTQTEKKAEDPLKSLPLDTSSVTQPNRSDYYVGAIGTGIGLLLCGAIGAYLLVGIPKLTVREQRTEARTLTLTLAGLLGASLILLGALYFYSWSDSLMNWLDKGEVKEAKWAAIPLLMVLAGGAIMLLGSLPARAEERNNPTIRWLVYGSNLALTTLLLFVVLIVINAVVALQIPNKLDVTSESFYTLSPPTKQLLEGLDQPIHAYAIMQASSDPFSRDTKRLLEVCRDANPSKFQVTFYSPAMNKEDINKLRNTYPMAEMSREGVLLVAGEEAGSDRKRHAFIRADELGEEKAGPDGKPYLAFIGEPKILRELMFLAENKQRPKIYFTQSSGELAISASVNPGAKPDQRRTADLLKKYLDKNYFDVQPLTFDPVGIAKVPDDAAVVVVADPVSTLPPNGVEAIRKYMSEMHRDAKKGKLVVLAGGSQRGTDGKPLKLGLEPLLGSFGVQLSDRFLYNVPSDRSDPRDPDMGTRVTIAGINVAAVEARNPVALAFASNVERLPLVDCREVNPMPAGPAQTVALLTSLPGRPTWTEAVYSPRPAATWLEFKEQIQKIIDGPGTSDQKQKQIEEMAVAKQINRRPHDLAVFVSEGNTARVAVFGCGWFVSDDASGLAQGQSTTIWLDLMGATLDWIRDRPSVTGVTEKPYTTYTLKPGYNEVRMVWLPVILAVLITVGLGSAVWVVRRK